MTNEPPALQPLGKAGTESSPAAGAGQGIRWALCPGVDPHGNSSTNRP